MIQMLSHGFVSAALFLVVGVVYDRLHTRDIDRYGGLADTMPAYAFVFMIFMLASVGLPGTSGFVGEFLILLGTFRVSTLEAFLAATALFLGAMYMLYLYRRVIFGTITRDEVRAHARSEPAREGGVRAAPHARAVDGHLSRARFWRRSGRPSMRLSRASRPCRSRPAQPRTEHVIPAKAGTHSSSNRDG